MEEWLKKKPDELDLANQRLALAEYIVENGLEESLPKPGIELWRTILPKIAKRLLKWSDVKPL